MKGRLRKLLKEERASAIIIEYTLVFPVVLGIVFILIFTGYMQHQKSVMQGAVDRGAKMAGRIITDPNYKTITKAKSYENDENDIDVIEINKDTYSKHDPYRYLFSKGGTQSDIENYVTAIIKHNQVFLDNNPVVEAIEDAGIFSKVRVTAKQDYEMPVVLPMLGLPKVITIEAKSNAYINQPAEFIRNADYAIDLVKPLIDKVDAKFNGIAGQVVEKVKAAFSKISFFKDNLK